MTNTASESSIASDCWIFPPPAAMDTDFAGEYRSLADPGHLADVESDPKKVGQRGMTSPGRADLHLWLDCFHRAHCTVLVQDKQLQPRGTTHLQLLFNYFELLSARGYRDTVTRKWSWTEATLHFTGDVWNSTFRPERRNVSRRYWKPIPPPSKTRHENRGTSRKCALWHRPKNRRTRYHAGGGWSCG